MPKNRSIGNIKNLGNGKYILRVSAGFDDYGRRMQFSRTVTATSDTDAERQLMKLYQEKTKLVQGRGSQSPKTLNAAYAEWIDNHVKPNLERRTLQYYEDLWDRYIDAKGGAKLNKLSPRIIQDIINNVNAGQRTKQGVYSMLRAMLNKAVKWGYIADNPCNKLDSPKYETAPKDVYTQLDLKNMFSCLVKEPVIYQLATWLAVSRGARREEIVGLKWDDVDFEQKTIYIRRAAVRIKKEGMIEKSTKNKKSQRVLSLSDDLMALFRIHKAQQDHQRLLAGSKWQDEGWVFANWRGELYSSDTITNWWCGFLKSNDLKKIRFHDLRHTAATTLLINNVDIASVSNILGHSRQSTTLNVYSHVISDSKAAAFNALDTAIEDAKKRKAE